MIFENEKKRMTPTGGSGHSLLKEKKNNYENRYRV